MGEDSAAADRESEKFSMVDPRIIDPQGEIVNYEHLADDELDQVVEVMEALHHWHRAERSASEASRRYMKLGDSDMRALRYAIAAQNGGEMVTPGALAEHLSISTASVTKMLDRLATAGHIRRRPHPMDRRSVAIEVTDETRKEARQVVGRMHAARFYEAAQLSRSERAAVIRFLHGLTATTQQEPGQTPPSAPGTTSQL